MNKKMLLAIFSVGLFFAHAVNASDYGLCINRSRGDMKKQIDCNNDEVRSQMRQINQKIAQIGRNSEFMKLNKGQTTLENQFKYWQAFRNNYCTYAGVANGAYGDGAYFKSDCMRLLTQQYSSDLDKLMHGIYADPE